jgi:hypothetical protein
MLSLLLATVFAQTIELPPTVEVVPGTLVKVTPVKLDGGKTVRYFSPNPELFLLDNDELKDSSSTYLSSAKPGKYVLYAVTAAGDKISKVAIASVIVGGSAPVPPPTPDEVRRDPLFGALEGIVGGLNEPNAKATLVKLAQVYSDCADGLPGCSTLNDVINLQTDLMAKAKVGASLSAVRRRIAGEMADKIGENPDLKLDADLLQRLKTQYVRFSSILKKLAE